MSRYILAPDSFKGTMTAAEVCAVWEEGIRAHEPEARVTRLPMADGGEGMAEAYLGILGGERVRATVSGPFFEPVEAAYGILPDGTAVMEMAACAGLPLAGDRRDPMNATTYGVGELLRHAEGRGVKKALLGLGGSATNDCGIGMAAALGWRFLDETGGEVEPLAKNMERIRRAVRPREALSLSVTAACDVDNPLFGPRGAAYTFGPQKGAQGETLVRLDAGLRNMAGVLLREGIAVADVPGAGAAGGLGAGVLAFLGGALRPGVGLLLDAAGFDEMLSDADLVFTGEGRIDGQSVYGKVPVGVARRAKQKGVPVVALCGSIGEDAAAVYTEGVTAIFSAVRNTGDFASVQKTCVPDMRFLIDAVMRLLRMRNNLR